MFCWYGMLFLLEYSSSALFRFRFELVSLPVSFSMRFRCFSCARCLRSTRKAFVATIQAVASCAAACKAVSTVSRTLLHFLGWTWSASDIMSPCHALARRSTGCSSKKAVRTSPCKSMARCHDLRARLVGSRSGLYSGISPSPAQMVACASTHRRCIKIFVIRQPR